VPPDEKIMECIRKKKIERGGEGAALLNKPGRHGRSTVSKRREVCALQLLCGLIAKVGSF